MKEVGRMDLVTGCVPDYRTFVRHLWTYKEPGLGSCIAEPPWVYACVFESTEESALAKEIVQSVIVSEKVASDRLEARRMFEGDELIWEIRFRDLEALHLFLVHMAATSIHDGSARQIGEFLMWTLGFRWV
jgi:hypothetical protein